MDTTEPPRKVRRGDRQTRFLAQSVVLEEAGSSGLIRIAMVTIVVVICAFLVWSAVTNVDEVAGARLILNQSICCGSEMLVKAKVTIVMINTSRRARRLPKAVREKLISINP